MRRERKEREKKRNNRNAIFYGLSVIYGLIFVVFVGMVVRLNVLPTKYLVGLIVATGIISVLLIGVMVHSGAKKGLKIGGAVVAVLLMIGYGVGCYYMVSTLTFIEEITVADVENTEIPQVYEDYYVIVSSQSEYEEISQLIGGSIGTYAITDETYSEAKNMLQEEIDVEYCYVEDLENLFYGLPEGGYSGYVESSGSWEEYQYDAIFVSAATYELLTSEMSELTDETVVIYTVSVPVEKSSAGKSVAVTDEAFNIYISGLDVTGSISNVSRSDVNMIVTVNPSTKEILITSIPRDYYVNLPSKNAMDKLTHTGLYGIEETVSAVEELMGIEINYYVKVNYTTVIDLVDAIGGIDIISPYTFTTHKMQELSGITFYAGENHLTGSMALAYCRERASFANGDMQRNENQQLILEAIIEKCTSSTTILSSYTSILSAISGNMETNFTEDEITSLIKMQLNDMAGWTITKNALKGDSTTAFCYSLGLSASVVKQDQEQIVEAADLIVKIMSGETEDTNESAEE